MKKNRLFIFLFIFLFSILSVQNSFALYNIESETLDIPDTVVDLSGIEMDLKHDGSGIKGLTIAGVDFPNEGALLIGVSGNSNKGTFLEFRLVAPGRQEWASVKFPVGYMVSDIEVSGQRETLTPFPGDIESAEAARNVIEHDTFAARRLIENRTNISAHKYIGGSGDPFGITASYVKPFYYVGYTAWAPEYEKKHLKPGLSYIKGGITPSIGSLDFNISFKWWGGEMQGKGKRFGGSIFSAEAVAFDARAKGYIGTYPLTLRLSYAIAKGSRGSYRNLMNLNASEARSAYSVEGEVGVVEDKLNLSLGYRAAKTGDAVNNNDNALVLGVIYALPHMVQLRVNHMIYSGDYYDLPANLRRNYGSRLTTVMLSASI